MVPILDSSWGWFRILWLQLMSAEEFLHISPDHKMSVMGRDPRTTFKATLKFGVGVSLAAFQHSTLSSQQAMICVSADKGLQSGVQGAWTAPRMQTGEFNRLWDSLALFIPVYFRAQHHHLYQKGKEKFLNRNVLDIHAVWSKTAPKVNKRSFPWWEEHGIFLPKLDCSESKEQEMN